MGHNSVGIGYNFYYLFLFLLVLFIFEIIRRNKVQPPTDTQSPHSGRKSTMSTASFLTFATLLVLMTLSWSQPGEAALRTSDHGDPERAAGQYMGHQIRKPGPCADRCAGNYRVRGNIAQKQSIKNLAKRNAKSMQDFAIWNATDSKCAHVIAGNCKYVKMPKR